MGEAVDGDPEAACLVWCRGLDTQAAKLGGRLDPQELRAAAADDGLAGDHLELGAVEPRLGERGRPPELPAAGRKRFGDRGEELVADVEEGEARRGLLAGEVLDDGREERAGRWCVGDVDVAGAWGVERDARELEDSDVIEPRGPVIVLRPGVVPPAGGGLGELGLLLDEHLDLHERGVVEDPGEFEPDERPSTCREHRLAAAAGPGDRLARRVEELSREQRAGVGEALGADKRGDLVVGSGEDRQEVVGQPQRGAPAVDGELDADTALVEDGGVVAGLIGEREAGSLAFGRVVLCPHPVPRNGLGVEVVAVGVDALLEVEITDDPPSAGRAVDRLVGSGRVILRLGRRGRGR